MNSIYFAKNALLIRRSLVRAQVEEPITARVATKRPFLFGVESDPVFRSSVQLIDGRLTRVQGSQP